MAYDDPNQDEDGEPIFDPDVESEPEASSEPVEDNWEQDPDTFSVGADSAEDEAPKSKPRKRLIKKTAKESSPDEEEHEEQDEQEERYEKRKGRESGEDEPPRKSRKERNSGDVGKGKSKSGGAAKLARLSKGSKKKEKVTAYHGGKRGETEMKEMWDSVVGGESEDDNEGKRTKEDDAFIDDTGVEPDARFVYSDEEAGSVGDAPQAEEVEDGDDLRNMFKSSKSRNKKLERTPEETAMLVEQFMARLEVAAEEDAELNRQSKPAINKLKMLPALISVLSKRQLQQEFLDRGILSVLKNWLEPLPDGSLPNMTIRSALLKILTDLPIDVELYDRREQLKKSGLGKVIMFLSRTDEEATANRKLARDLVDKWSRPIFQKSTRYEDLRNFDEERPPPPRPSVKKPTVKSSAGFQSRGGDDLDIVDGSQEPKPGQPGYRFHAAVPEALPLDFVVRPSSKIDPDEVRARARQQRLDERRMKMNKKLQQLKAPKKKLQAEKISVEGRGLVKYF